MVGVDGSSTARQALRWAVEEARVRRASLEVVSVWQLPYLGEFPYTDAVLDPSLLESEARKELDEMVDSVDTSALHQPVKRLLSSGGAAATLLDVAEGADVLVVGSRGLGGFKGLLLGSVSHQVSHHASCPVVVVPPER